MITFDTRTEHLLTLRAAVNFYPQASWSTDDRGLDRWSTDDFIAHARMARAFDLDQLVLLIDRAIYPAVARKQEDVLPLLFLMSETPDPSNLENFLIHSYCLWLDLNGVCWHPEELRQQLTLEQRATEIYAIENAQFDSIGGGWEVIAGATEVILFVLVDSLAHAQDAHAALERLGIGAAVVGARAMQYARGEQLTQETETFDLVIAKRQIHDLDSLAIQQRLPPSGCVRMADRDDIPYWPIHEV
jgi:hypothetical protein